MPSTAFRCGGPRERRSALQSHGPLASAGVRPEDVWREWSGASICRESPRSCRNRRQNVQEYRNSASNAAPAAVRRRIVALEGAPARSGTNPPNFSISGMDKFAPRWFIAPCQTNLRLVHRRRPQAISARIMGAVSFAESSFFRYRRCDADPDVGGAAAAGLVLRRSARSPRCWAASSATPSARCSTIRSGNGDPDLRPQRQGRGLPRLLCRVGRVDHYRKGLTPIPYKLVTITSGFPDYNFWLFLLCSIIAAAAASSWSPSCSTATANGSGRNREAPGAVGGDRRHRPCARICHRVEADQMIQSGNRFSAKIMPKPRMRS